MPCCLVCPSYFAPALRQLTPLRSLQRCASCLCSSKVQNYFGPQLRRDSQSCHCGRGRMEERAGSAKCIQATAHPIYRGVPNERRHPDPTQSNRNKLKILFGGCMYLCVFLCTRLSSFSPLFFSPLSYLLSFPTSLSYHPGPLSPTSKTTLRVCVLSAAHPYFSKRKVKCK